MPERRSSPRAPVSSPRRRRFPSVPVALAGGALCTAGAVVAVWLALREPAQATPGPPPTAAAALRGTAPLEPMGAPSSLVVAPPAIAGRDAGVATAAGSDEDGDEPSLPSDNSGLMRADVVAAINAVRPQLARCARDPSLIGVVKITVSSSGHVTAAQVSGALAGTTAGECVAGVARSAVFRGSRREQTVVSWPVALGRFTSASGAREVDSE